MWFEPATAWLVALVTSAIPWLKEKTTKPIPAENWANKDLQYKDRMAGVSEKEILRRAEQGRYYLPISKNTSPNYPIPHRTDDALKKIIIENCDLHREDIEKYGSTEVYKWVSQGKYNLTEEELRIARLHFEKKYTEWLYPPGTYSYKDKKARLEEISKILATANWDYRKTEAVSQWEKAHAAESKYH